MNMNTYNRKVNTTDLNQFRARNENTTVSNHDLNQKGSLF